jgi:hypothetical protein
MVHIQLPDALGTRLENEAHRRGVDASQFASQLLERALARPSLDEILAPFRKQVEESGLTDEQLDALFQDAREQAWNARSHQP